MTITSNNSRLRDDVDAFLYTARRLRHVRYFSTRAGGYDQLILSSQLSRRSATLESHLATWNISRLVCFTNDWMIIRTAANRISSATLCRWSWSQMQWNCWTEP